MYINTSKDGQSVGRSVGQSIGDRNMLTRSKGDRTNITLSLYSDGSNLMQLCIHMYIYIYTYVCYSKSCLIGSICRSILGGV